MANGTPAPPKKPGGLQTIGDVPIDNPQGLKPIYANHFGVSATMTDLTIYFLEVGQMPDSGKVGNAQFQEVRAIVTIPTLLAQGIIQTLQQVLMQQHRGLESALKQQKMSEQGDGGKK